MTVPCITYTQNCDSSHLIYVSILLDVGPLNPTIHQGLEWPLELNSLLSVGSWYVCMLQIF